MSSFLSPLLVQPSRSYRLRNLRSGKIVAGRLESAFDSSSRRKGLLGRLSLAPDTALVLAPCSGVHTCFMHFPIDVVFVARDGRVRKIRRNLPPWRIAIALRAFAVIELGAGALAPSNTSVSDTLALELP